MKPSHHAREHIDRQRDPWAPDGLTGFFIDDHYVHPSMVDLDDSERLRRNVVMGRRLRGLDRGLVLAALRYDAHVEIFNPRLNRTPVRWRESRLKAAKPDLLHEPAKLRLLRFEVEPANCPGNQRLAFRRKRPRLLRPTDRPRQ